MNPDDFRWTDKNCLDHRTCGLDPCGGVSTCPDGREVALFVPLRNEHYLAFRSGVKTTEFRRAGIVTDKKGIARQSPWNADTCRPGRPAILSNGYQIPGRMPAVVELFREQDDAPAAFDEIYPGHRANGGRVAAITFMEIDR